MKAEQQQEQFGDVLGKVFVLAILAALLIIGCCFRRI